MSNHINQRIASLRELIEGGLHQENLDRIVFECNTLSQDTSHVLTFFVLKQVFVEMSAALEGEAVAVAQHKDLISSISELAILILDKVENDEPIETADLENLVRAHIRNVNIFRADR
jgi:hypothetical protein